METLRGVTWDHVRGFDPLEATAKAFASVQPEVSVLWERRSLQALADFPIDRLAETYDLVMLDHPWVGTIASSEYLLPIDTLVEAELLAGLSRDSTGPSFESYRYGQHLWALPIDAAAQVSARGHNSPTELPATWDDVLLLAKECSEGSPGRVGMPLIPVDAFCAFATMCASRGEVPFRSQESAVSDEVGLAVLEWMQRFVALADERSLSWNPPTMLEEMSTTGDISYVPLLFGYSNYSRGGFRPRLVEFADIPVATAGAEPSGAILGGVGLGISRKCAHSDAAVSYATYVASAAVQGGIYFAAGGQPASWAAWSDDDVNARSGQFFRNTSRTLRAAQVRPRYSGFISFQDRCGLAIHSFLREGSSLEGTLEHISQLWDESVPI